MKGNNGKINQKFYKGKRSLSGWNLMLSNELGSQAGPKTSTILKVLSANSIDEEVKDSIKDIL